MSELYELPEGWEWKSINDVVQKTKNNRSETMLNELDRVSNIVYDNNIVIGGSEF